MDVLEDLQRQQEPPELDSVLVFEDDQRHHPAQIYVTFRNGSPENLQIVVEEPMETLQSNGRWVEQEICVHQFISLSSYLQ